MLFIQEGVRRNDGLYLTLEVVYSCRSLQYSFSQPFHSTSFTSRAAAAAAAAFSTCPPLERLQELMTTSQWSPLNLVTDILKAVDLSSWRYQRVQLPGGGINRED